MTGTSMASPYVAGVIGLMLAVSRPYRRADPRHPESDRRPLPGGTYEWVNDCGFGVITPEACLKEAGRITARNNAKKRFEGRVS